MTDLSATGNPFLAIGPVQRFVVVAYLLIYRGFFPAIAASGGIGASDLLLERYLMELAYTLLLAYPFLFYRADWGWLHPLILPTVYTIAKDLGKNPIQLFSPIDNPLVNLAVETPSVAAALVLPDDALATMRLGEAFIRCLALLVYYLAFHALRTPRPPRVEFREPRNLALYAAFGIAVTTLITLAFIASMGGVTSLVVAMRGGRVALFQGQGQFLVISGFGLILASLWFSHSKRPLLDLPLLIGLFVTGALTLLTSGSRSALIYPIIVLVLVWSKRQGRLMIGPAVGAALAGLVILGGFGAVRQDYNSDTIDTSVFEISRLPELVTRALGETAVRDSEESNLAAFAGANNNGLLLGQTYVGAAVFWLPRAIWPDKPRSADAYNMWYNFVGNPVGTPLPERGYWGIPVSGVHEAFWNFHIVGVLAFGVLMAFVHKYAVAAVLANQQAPAAWLIYIYIVLNFVGTAISFIDVARDIGLLIGFLYICGVLRPAPRKRSSTRVLP